MADSNRYFTDVLRGLGASPQAISGSVPFLNNWAGREGVPQTIDAYNLLGTTLAVGGSHGTNAPGVQSYPSYDAGVEATRRMLSQPNFSAIRKALLSGNPDNFRNDSNVQNEFGLWSGGGYTWPSSGAAPPALPAGSIRSTGSTGSSGSTGSVTPTSSGPNIAALLALTQSAPPALDLPSWSNVPETSRDNLLPLLLASLGQSAPAAAKPTVTQAPIPQRGLQSADVANLVHVSPTANRAGVPLDRGVIDFVGQVARMAGRPLTIGTGSNHNEYVAGSPGRVSAHWSGRAADIPSSGHQLTSLGQAALVAAGMSPAEAAKQKGGLFNIGGYQIIFNSNIGGNHFNHLHVGLRG